MELSHLFWTPQPGPLKTYIKYIAFISQKGLQPLHVGNPPRVAHFKYSTDVLFSPFLDPQSRLSTRPHKYQNTQRLVIKIYSIYKTCYWSTKTHMLSFTQKPITSAEFGFFLVLCNSFANDPQCHNFCKSWSGFLPSGYKWKKADDVLSGDIDTSSGEKDKANMMKKRRRLTQ